MTDRTAVNIILSLGMMCLLGMFVAAVTNLAGGPLDLVTRAIEKTFVRLLTGRIAP